MTGRRRTGNRVAGPGILARLDAQPMNAVALVPRQAYLYVAGHRQCSLKVLDRFLPLTLPLSIGHGGGVPDQTAGALPTRATTKAVSRAELLSLSVHRLDHLRAAAHPGAAAVSPLNAQAVAGSSPPRRIGVSCVHCRRPSTDSTSVAPAVISQS